MMRWRRRHRLKRKLSRYPLLNSSKYIENLAFFVKPGSFLLFILHLPLVVFYCP
jgi:hypothetical protein